MMESSALAVAAICIAASASEPSGSFRRKFNHSTRRVPALHSHPDSARLYDSNYAVHEYVPRESRGPDPTPVSGAIPSESRERPMTDRLQQFKSREENLSE